MKYRHVVLCVCGVVLVALAAVVWRRPHKFDWEGSEGAVLSEVENLRNGLAVFMLDELTTGQGGGRTRTEWLRDFNNHRAQYYVGNPRYLKISPGGFFVDVWGNALHFKFATPVTDESAREVMVWSCGRNGVDEGGTGDDIVARPPAGRD